MTPRDISPSVRDLLRWYAVHGRAHLPWRAEPTPYRVVVSEFMLQQTQVERVLPAFEAFVARFPGFERLAAASRADVVRAWRGLGYNSRAVRLHELARAVRDRHAGALPNDETALRALPGVGSYTARAILAFAFGVGVVAVDTNVRRIVHRTLFGLEHPPKAADTELTAAAAAFVVPEKSFAINSALMDLGAAICTARAPKCLICPLRRRCAAAPIDAASLAQAASKTASRAKLKPRQRFEQTTRFLRGRIVDRLRSLPPCRAISFLELRAELRPLLAIHGDAGFSRALEALEREGLLERAGGRVRLVV